MVEVFKTNVRDLNEATLLVEKLHEHSEAYKANFDLEDSDKILRIQSDSGLINPKSIIEFLKKCGYEAQVLPD